MEKSLDEPNSALLQKLTPEEGNKADSAPKKDNPKLGILFFILSGISFAFNFIFAKIIYENKPQTTPMQLLSYRAIISTGSMAIKVNRNLKSVCYDSIESNQWFPLWMRTI